MYKKGVIIFCFILLVGLVSAGDNILVRGNLVDSLTGQPVSGAKLISAYEFSPSEVYTDSDGSFSFNIHTDFILKDSGESSDRGRYSFFKDCYDYSYMEFIENYTLQTNLYPLVWVKEDFDTFPKYFPVTNEVLDVGNIKIYPNANLEVSSDILSTLNVQYKYKTLAGYNGVGSGFYSTEHTLPNSLPFNYSVFIQFEDELGNKYSSSSYTIPVDAFCKTIVLKYFNGKSEWYVKPEGFFEKIFFWFKNLFS